MKYSASYGTGYSLGPWRRNFLSKLERAALRATDRASKGAHVDIRRAMSEQRLGGLSRAIRQTSDLKKGTVKRTGDGGFSASGIVYPHITSERTAGALDAYLGEGSTTITPKKGRYLWIATREIPRKAGRKRMTPQLYIDGGFESRIGPLQFVINKKGQALLVVSDVTVNPLRSGSAKRLPKNGRARAGRQSVGIVAFVGIRKTTRGRRVSPQAIGARWRLRLGRFLAEEMEGG